MPNSEQSVTRRLAAILIADVVGYTRLMERDDTGTFSRLRTIRDEVVDPAVVSHDGRIVRTVGDGLMAEFASALSALRAAVHIQREMTARNADVPADERIEYRIGINLGDVMVDGSDLAGDGINVAARLETLCEPGGICVSGSVREQVHGTLDVRFEDMGEQQVKNIARPIQVFAVRFAGGETRTMSAGRTSEMSTNACAAALVARTMRPRGWWAAGVTLALAGVAAAWLLLLLSKPPPAAADSLPPYSLAILPFAAASDSAADRQFAEELTRDLTTGMGRKRWASVAAPSLASAFTGKIIDLPSVGKKLNVRYIAEGDVRHVGEKLVVMIRLADAKTRKQTWSDQREYEAAALAANPDAAKLQLTRRLAGALADAESSRIGSDPTQTGPVDLVSRGEFVWGTEPGPGGARAARKYFEAALKLDPNFGPALIDAAFSYSAELSFGPNADHRLFEQKMDGLTGRAVSIDSSDADAWLARAQALEWLGRWEEALSALERAEALDPSLVDVHISRAWSMISMGRPLDALAAARRAATIDPPGGGDPQLLTCKSYLYLGRYDDAVTACEKSAGLNNSWIDQVYLTAAYAQRGDAAKAKIAKDELLKLQPGYTIERYRQTWYSGTPAFFDLVEKHLAAGLRKAGIPEK